MSVLLLLLPALSELCLSCLVFYLCMLCPGIWALAVAWGNASMNPHIMDEARGREVINRIWARPCIVFSQGPRTVVSRDSGLFSSNSGAALPESGQNKLQSNHFVDAMLSIRIRSCPLAPRSPGCSSTPGSLCPGGSPSLRSPPPGSLQSHWRPFLMRTRPGCSTWDAGLHSPG